MDYINYKWITITQSNTATNQVVVAITMKILVHYYDLKEYIKREED